MNGRQSRFMVVYAALCGALTLAAWRLTGSAMSVKVIAPVCGLAGSLCYRALA